MDGLAKILPNEQAYVPLYTQLLLWRVADGIELIQRSDHLFILRWVTKAKSTNRHMTITMAQ